MSGGRVVELPRSPEVQVLGDAVVLRGAAVLDAYRLLGRGIEAARERDGIEPSVRLLQTMGALKAAALHVRADTADVRESAVSAESLMTGEVVRVEEVARMLGVSQRQARRLCPQLGGRMTSKGWRLDRGLVQKYIEMKASA